MVAVSNDLRLQVAVFRAKLIARSDFRRAVALLVAARVRIEAAIAYVAKLVGAAALVQS